jgi:tetratricopeptide (TPR) repeat protein
LGEGHASLAFIAGMGDWNWKASEAGFLRAEELNPSRWATHYWFGIVLGLCSRTDEAMRQIEKALDLEPLSPIIRHAAAMILLGVRRTGEAIQHCLKALEIDPDYFLARLWLGIAYKQESKYDQAILELERATELTGGGPVAAGPLGHAYAVAGRNDEARRLLGRLQEPTGHRHVDPYSLAVIYVGLGEQDQALELLEKACDAHSGLLTSEIKIDPAWDAFRSHARFASVLQRMGIPAGGKR